MEQRLNSLIYFFDSHICRISESLGILFIDVILNREVRYAGMLKCFRQIFCHRFRESLPIFFLKDFSKSQIMRCLSDSRDIVQNILNPCVFKSLNIFQAVFVMLEK